MDCECRLCFYCGMPLSRRHEHDHYPVPKHAGGRETVPACMNCHELKDRTPLPRWDAGEFARALLELLEGVSVEGVDLDTEMSAADVTAVIGDVGARWPTLSPVARVLYAKLRYLAESERQLADDRRARVPMS